MIENLCSQTFQKILTMIIMYLLNDLKLTTNRDENILLDKSINIRVFSTVVNLTF